jgi:O-antigen ligase
MIANGRRLVWVEVSIVAIIVLLMTPWTPVKRALVRGLVLLMPVMPVYIAAGWNSDSGIFKPVKTLRSIADSKSDRSTETRDIENFNLIYTLKEHSIVPLGFGHEYTEMVQADDISQYFAQYRFIPHNSVLGLWAFAGVLGFTGLWMMIGVAVFFAARAYRMTRDVDHQTAALSCIGAIFCYLMQAYGDMGLVNWIGVFLLAPAMVVAGKLAVATGAYPSTRQVAASAPVPLPAPVAVLGPEEVTAR